MPRRHKHKKMTGGFDFSSIGNSFSSLGTSVSSWWNKDKTQSSYVSPTSSYVSPTTSSQSTYIPNATGGKKKHTKRMRGGVKGWTPLTGIGAHGAPVSGISVAKAHNYVGGKTRRRKQKNTRRH